MPSSGSGFTTFACTGETQTSPSGRAAGCHGGPALVSASLLQCQGVGADLTCFFIGISTSEEIRIHGG